MRDSDTYLAIIDEGREAEVRHLILKVAQKHLGEADEQTRTRLEGITDIDRLERIHDRLLERAHDGTFAARTWQGLLDTP